MEHSKELHNTIKRMFPNLKDEYICKMTSDLNGFEGLFTESMDKPYFDKHLFFMYRTKPTKSYFILDSWFRKQYWFVDSFLIREKDKSHTVYCLNCPYSIRIDVKRQILPLDIGDIDFINNSIELPFSLNKKLLKRTIKYSILKLFSLFVKRLKELFKTS